MKILSKLPGSSLTTYSYSPNQGIPEETAEQIKGTTETQEPTTHPLYANKEAEQEEPSINQDRRNINKSNQEIEHPQPMGAASGAASYQNYEKPTTNIWKSTKNPRLTSRNITQKGMKT